MIEKEFKLPIYAKATFFFISLFALFAILYIAQGIIIPIVFAFIISIVLHPVVNFFVSGKINRVIAIILTLFLTFIVIASLGALLFSEASQFSESWPTLVEKSTGILNQSINGIAIYFNINPQDIHDWITKNQNELINTSSAAIGQTLMTVGSGVVILILLPVYTFLILLYQPLLRSFIRKLFNTKNQVQVSEIVTQTKKLIQHYIRGLLFEAIIVATLYSIGLLIIGIEYAILLGFIAALLNIIPYIGGIIALLLISIITIATKDSASYLLLVATLAIIIHLLDNSFIIPKIVASKVKINALFSIIAVIAGDALWGIPGMFLSIPLLAIVKLIFDHVDHLKPWGFLLGDTMPPILIIKPIVKKKIK